MKLLHFDPLFGISGDMTIGAMLDLGLPFEILSEGIKTLGLDDCEIEVHSVLKSGISAKHFIVKYETRHHDHGHHGRTLGNIKDIISGSSLSPWIKEKAAGMFEVLADVEGTIHQVSRDKVHFHEVGAVDSIVDIVGACIGMEYFKPDHVTSGRVNLGSGYIDTQHGRLPVPPPAVAELVKGMPVFTDDSNTELTTPTGALILKAFVDEFVPDGTIKIDGIGYGAGTREFKDRPNLLRIMSVQTDADNSLKQEDVTVLETQVDDMTSENLGFLMDELFEVEALDVFYTPVFMKKSRPAYAITVISRPDKADSIATMLLCSSSSLGVRKQDIKRYVLDRKFVTVKTRFGDVKLKVASGIGIEEKFSPEYEDCKNLAKKHRVPIIDIQNEAIKTYMEQEKSDE